MKNIKTPVRPRGNYIMEGEAPSSHYLLKVFCEGDGNESKDVKSAVGAASEIALTLNLHDNLMSLCEAVLRAELATDPETKRDYWRVATIAARAIAEEVRADAALAKLEDQ